jgi:hypothetical protein
MLWALGLVVVALAAPTATAGEITIQVSPNTLNLQSNGRVVTVHTDVPYPDIDVYTVYLLDVPIQSWKASSRGYFVAKFHMDDVKAIDGLALNELNSFKFVALTKSGEPVWGYADVMVADRGWRPSGNNQDTVDE